MVYIYGGVKCIDSQFKIMMIIYKIFFKIYGTTEESINDLTLHISGVYILDVFMKTVLYVSTQPKSKIVLILGDDNFTILKITPEMKLSIKFQVSQSSVSEATDLHTFLIHIMQTCPCNVHPLKPHFYIVKVGFTGVYIIFLFLL